MTGPTAAISTGMWGFAIGSGEKTGVMRVKE